MRWRRYLYVEFVTYLHAGEKVTYQVMILYSTVLSCEICAYRLGSNRIKNYETCKPAW